MTIDILVVDDEPDIRQMLSFALEGAGYTFREAGNAEETYAEVRQSIPDLILLDWMMPGASGVDVARKLRRDNETRDIPIIMLTARGEEDDKIRGLECGVDDYVTKPFSTRELMARIKAVLRRAEDSAAPTTLTVEELCLDTESHRVLIKGQNVELSPTEFKLLHFFIAHPERVYSRTQLLDLVWGDNVYIEERTVDVHIRRLRKILAAYDYDSLIQTVRSVGYRFSTQT